MDAGGSRLRRNALSKLAALSAQTPTVESKSELQRIGGLLTIPEQSINGYLQGVFKAITPISRVPMSIQELEVLLALCSAATKLSDLEQASRLVAQLSTYLPETHTQVFAPSPHLQEIKPSPGAVLSFQLTNALLVLGIRFPSLKSPVRGAIESYIRSWSEASQALSSQSYDEANEDDGAEQEAAEAASIAVSLVGFMEAAAKHENFWNSFERLELIRLLKTALSDKFMITIETASSTIRNSVRTEFLAREWRRYSRRYAANGSPLGAMLLQQAFIRLVLSCTSRLLCSEQAVESGDLLEQYIAGVYLERAKDEDITDEMIEYLVDVIADEMRVLEDGSDYLQLSSAWQQRLAFSVKAYAIEAFLHCMVLDEDIADAEMIFGWLEDSISNQVQMSDDDLAGIVLRSLAVVAKYMPEAASNIARLLLKFIVQSTSRSASVAVAARCLSHILQILSSDAIITTLFSLGNVLSEQTAPDKTLGTYSPFQGLNGHHNSLASAGGKKAGSVISLSLSGEEETSVVCGNVAHAIVMVATSCRDGRIASLALTMMLQKIIRVSAIVAPRLIEEAAVLAIHVKEGEFKALLRLYSRLHENALRDRDIILAAAVQNARIYLARAVDRDSPLFKVLTTELLERITSKGDVVETDFKRFADVEKAAEEIALLLGPLSILFSLQQTPASEGILNRDTGVARLAREAWYNIAAHGITPDSPLGKQYHRELRILAMHSLPLVDNDRAELLESDVELNTVLRRGMRDDRTHQQKKQLSRVIPQRESDVRPLSHQKVMYLNAVYSVESLRAESGSCAEILDYFGDPTLTSSHMGLCLSTIADTIIRRYTSIAIRAEYNEFGAYYVSRQLAQIFSACCHRSAKMQEVARKSADYIVSFVPSALCQKSALFALLELLTIMWSSCLEADIDEYEWRPMFTSSRGKITVELSDDYAFRRRTLNVLRADARKWVTSAMDVAPLDVKGLLQTYLSEYDDTGAYGHVSLGRSFALEMGSLIPSTDQRLMAIDGRGESSNINVASDFVAQYTTRQEYRYTGLPHHSKEWDDFVRRNKHAVPMSDAEPDAAEEARTILQNLELRLSRSIFVPIPELKDVLRRAAALLCRSKRSQTSLVRSLVNIPFQIFTKESVKLGISLWLGVIHENPRMEPRILTEVAQAWERIIERRRGIFNPHFKQENPFYLKEEFAPMDREVIHKQVQKAQNLISPHLRVFQFFESHFNSIRLGSTNTQRTFVRMIGRTLQAFQHLQSHPLTREMHFRVVLFALKVLRFSTCIDRISTWRLKDQIASAGLHWFAHPPAWSFGGNRITIKAEMQLMKEVSGMLQVSRELGALASPSRKDLQQKLMLLEALLNNEIGRLEVWIYPIGHVGHLSSDLKTAGFARLAWSEDPALAIQLLTRSPSEQMIRDIRFLLLNFPEKALQVPDAIGLLLGEALPHDISFQLKYLLYWNPVNPMQAVTYFMPAFGNHPFILQYAMRALESHAVDVTFFYVPQIVQALRYDALGYVERYIIETGKFSQLFAHQIIWNMKANSYKGDEGTEEDPLKPTMDKVTDNLISSFSGEDKDFYEREFAFFGEVTDISGKLKPFIKKSKPEKKAKIEEELRKIKVEVGVYLPSNPDGVVVGIDRKSGKPLQSHAKAPYMATFRIQKTRNQDNEVVSDMVQKAPQDQHPQVNGFAHDGKEVATVGQAETDSPTYEVWQSAIFKVGDDCRQDVLALQLIAAFRGIFNSVGLDVYVYPYRVTATAPGCGVIDVLPNSISRDMLGREAVNGLHDYFITKYGGEHSVRYQEARNEFVKSMAAYSVISYLLQFKDRHNGNIMVDDKGHILHIDFGFCFDIAPGGVKFERAPFKLSPEMIAVLGGGDARKSQSYRWFEELTVKAFLCSRQYCGQLCHIVQLMLDSGLPCFKPETMRNFKDRFQLQRNEREAAEFMLHCIKKSEANVSTMVYDEFQLLTNGIPY